MFFQIHFKFLYFPPEDTTAAAADVAEMEFAVVLLACSESIPPPHPAITSRGANAMNRNKDFMSTPSKKSFL
jgi:hypothetical protein